MKTSAGFLMSVWILAAAIGVCAAGEPLRIVCKHFLHGMPQSAASTHDLLIRDTYALSYNRHTRFADWVAYRLDEVTDAGGHSPVSRWAEDPWLDGAVSLKPGDYQGAQTLLGLDRGRLAPPESFKGSPEAWYMSNVVPMDLNLKNGPWLRLEEQERDMVRGGAVVYVLAGPLYEREMERLPGLDAPHEVPSGFWKIVAVQPEKDLASLRVAGFIFDQKTPPDNPIDRHVVPVAEIRKRTGLQFFPDLTEQIRRTLEGS